MTARRIIVLGCFAAVVVSAFGGCGDGLAQVTGTVALDGKPIEGGPQMYGTVSFYREDGGGVPAVGIIEESGRYLLRTGTRDGIAPGNYVIAISVKRITLPKRPEDMPLPVLITPKKYESVADSGLREAVTPGSNTFDFALSSQPAQP